MVFVIDVITLSEKKCDEAPLVLPSSLYQEIASMRARTCNSYH